MNFEVLQEEHHEWAVRTFPGETVSECIDHLLSEVEELKESPGDGSEMADILLLIMHIAASREVDLLKEAERKFNLCRIRKWEKTEQGWRHVKGVLEFDAEAVIEWGEQTRRDNRANKNGLSANSKVNADIAICCDVILPGQEEAFAKVIREYAENDANFKPGFF